MVCKACPFLVYDHIYHISVMLFSSSPFSNMELLLLKRNGSEIARKVPSNVTYSTLCFSIHTLISDVLIRGYMYS